MLLTEAINSPLYSLSALRSSFINITFFATVQLLLYDAMAVKILPVHLSDACFVIKNKLLKTFW